MPKSLVKSLVTGGAGFIGSHLAEALLEAGHDVVVADDLSAGLKENVPAAATFVKADITDRKSVEKLFVTEQPDYVFHLAAQINVRKSLANPIEDRKINFDGSKNIEEACQAYNVKKIVFASTAGAIGDTEEIPTTEDVATDPPSPYGQAKLEAEKMFALSEAEVVTLRFANVYGPRQRGEGEGGVVAVFSDRVIQEQTLIVNGDGQQTRDFVYVTDIVKACISALKSEAKGLYHVGTSIETSVNTLAEIVKKVSESKVDIEHGPAVPSEQRRSALSSVKIKEELGWTPKVGLEQGLKMTIEWFKDKNK